MQNNKVKIKMFLDADPPQSAKQTVWSADQTVLDLSKHQKYIIHQLLEYGDLDAATWLFKVYGKETVKKLFLTQAERIYSLKSFYFNSKFVLGLDPASLDQAKYVANF